MYEYNLDYVQDLCRLPAEARQSLARYYVDLPETVKIEAHKIQTDLSRQNRGKFDKSFAPEFYYVQFLLALQMMQGLETGQQRKVQLTDKEAGRISEIRLSRIRASRKKKSSPIRRLIEIRYYFLIARLRKEDLSWREISSYLSKFHKHSISYSYIQKVYEQKMNRETIND